MTETTEQPAVNPKKLLFLNRKAPYGSSLPREALDAVLMASAFGQQVTLVFLGDGVFQLKTQQDPSEIEMKNFSKTFAALELYGVSSIFVEQSSLQKRGLTLDQLLIPAKLIQSHELTELLEEQDQVMSF
ncbi:MAG: sulfurtransferase complex subunit TusC [Pseudomonadales bacterium]|nr:sulfurtransferase complex subunit TusC [Pseudomonadales bacterium]